MNTQTQLTSLPEQTEATIVANFLRSQSIYLSPVGIEPCQRLLSSPDHSALKAFVAFPDQHFYLLADLKCSEDPRARAFTILTGRSVSSPEAGKKYALEVFNNEGDHANVRTVAFLHLMKVSEPDDSLQSHLCRAESAVLSRAVETPQFYDLLCNHKYARLFSTLLTLNTWLVNEVVKGINDLKPAVAVASLGTIIKLAPAYDAAVNNNHRLAASRILTFTKAQPRAVGDISQLLTEIFCSDNFKEAAWLTERLSAVENVKIGLEFMQRTFGALQHTRWDGQSAEWSVNLMDGFHRF